MSDTATFEIHGADELQKDLEDFMSKYPAETEEALRKTANKFCTDVNKKFPNKGRGGTKTNTRKKIANSWRKTPKASDGMNVEIDLTNDHPIYHLVENGHVLVFDRTSAKLYEEGVLRFRRKGADESRKSHRSKDLVTMGFVPGKHYCASTRDEWSSGKFVDEMEKAVDKQLKKRNL